MAKLDKNFETCEENLPVNAVVYRVICIVCRIFHSVNAIPKLRQVLRRDSDTAPAIQVTVSLCVLVVDNTMANRLYRVYATSMSGRRLQHNSGILGKSVKENTTVQIRAIKQMVMIVKFCGAQPSPDRWYQAAPGVCIRPEKCETLLNLLELLQ